MTIVLSPQEIVELTDKVKHTAQARAMSEKITARRPKPYMLPATRLYGRRIEAWFYTNRGSIDLVVSEPGEHSCMYRLRLRDMKKIVEALS